VGEKNINLTIMWSLSEGLSTSGPIDDPFIQQQAIDLVQHKLISGTIRPYITAITSDIQNNSGSFLMSLSGEGDVSIP
jgi:hypothetical protein